jgi:hypothetical protein
VVTEWACDFCGYGGRTRLQPGETVDMIQCPMCGEPVTLVAEWDEG